MATDITMPQLGESIAEGTVVKWLIPQGGEVKKDQSLLEVETDKVALEIPSPAAGSLVEVFIQEGETVPVGTLLARLHNAGQVQGNGSDDHVARTSHNVGQSVTAAPDHLSPAVRQLASEHGVDVTKISGTGTGGRITKKDVLEFVANNKKTAGVDMGSHNGGSVQTTSSRREEILPLTPMRRTIAERMVHSRHTAAHVVTYFEADFSNVERARTSLNLTHLPFVIKAVTQAIHDFPILNSSWSEKGIVIKHEVHIGFAVSLDEGLLVPVIRHADQKGLAELGKEVADLAQRARTKQLNPDEVQEGTFTITNHGGTKSLFSTPIIHQPQIAILGVGTIQKRPIVINDAIAIRPMGYLSLSFDHRVIDGATADRFMTKVKEGLEQEQWEPKR